MKNALIRATSTIAGGLVLASAITGGLPASAAGEDTRLGCTTADDWTALFTRNGESGWLAADGIYSVSLDGVDSIGSASDDSKSFFIFSDTLVGSANAAGKVTRTEGMPNHSAALLEGTKPDSDSIEFVYGLKGSGKLDGSANLFGEGQWMFDCLVHDGSLYLFGFNQQDWKPSRIDMITVPIVDGTPNFKKYQRKRRITELLRITDDRHYDYGMGILPNTAEAGAPDPDGYLYFYGFIDNIHEFSRKDLIVSRISVDDFPDFEKLRYWNGSDWVEEITESAVILPDVSCEVSVTPITGGPYKGKYIAVYTKGVQTAHMMYAIGDSPVGPFDDPVEFYTAPETGSAAKGASGTLYTYNAKAHPHLSTDGRLLVSYNVNDNYGLAKDVYDHHPRFLYLDLGYTDEEKAALKKPSAELPGESEGNSGENDQNPSEEPGGVTTQPAPSDDPEKTKRSTDLKLILFGTVFAVFFVGMVAGSIIGSRRRRKSRRE